MWIPFSSIQSAKDQGSDTTSFSTAQTTPPYHRGQNSSQSETSKQQEVFSRHLFPRFQLEHFLVPNQPVHVPRVV